MKWFIALLFTAPAALAEICPPVADRSDELAGIYADLARSQSEAEAQPLNAQLWEIWTDAPDARAQDLLDEGMQRRAGFDFLGARDVLDELVAYCPDYAEGYNQRAFANYLRQDFAAALVDLDRTLEINPRHIGALSGKALTLMGLGRQDDAQVALREALALNPWLGERALLTRPLGEDI
ncbi:hypothetical protein SLH49_05825 [Cognatiyoonia sp. IB215446]|uniref:tetratricopeptide repeat protein n=1 Tax=Cognatiyoonia sp. IB215446 TaxID=3097355 RepID=UPI002A0AAE58|nr:hypothetical protein [Cognatiyoonia sp. IB215446]MDX8347501.1 hypothetical protein [Cognatiyoonia sp. IB215446]